MCDLEVDVWHGAYWRKIIQQVSTFLEAKLVPL